MELLIILINFICSFFYQNFRKKNLRLVSRVVVEDSVSKVEVKVPAEEGDPLEVVDRLTFRNPELQSCILE